MTYIMPEIALATRDDIVGILNLPRPRAADYSFDEITSSHYLPPRDCADDDAIRAGIYDGWNGHQQLLCKAENPWPECLHGVNRVASARDSSGLYFRSSPKKRT
jgi:hypothetical protein